MNLRPLHDYGIVRRQPETQLSAGGTVIPDSAAEKPARGELLAVGRGRLLKNGELVKPDARPGMQFFFGNHAGIEIRLEGEEPLAMRESDIPAVAQA